MKFNTPRSLMSQASIACIEIHNVCPADVFHQMTRNSNAVLFGLLAHIISLIFSAEKFRDMWVMLTPGDKFDDFS